MNQPPVTTVDDDEGDFFFGLAFTGAACALDSFCAAASALRLAAQRFFAAAPILAFASADIVRCLGGATAAAGTAAAGGAKSLIDRLRDALTSPDGLRNLALLAPIDPPAAAVPRGEGLQTIVLAGGSGWDVEGSGALAQFAEAFDLPVAVTFRRQAHEALIHRLDAEQRELIEPQSRLMLEGVLRMADLTAGDIMLAGPRMDLLDIAEASLAEKKYKARQAEKIQQLAKDRKFNLLAHRSP